ncbi:hypothetical protein [Bartonella florencae]|uniref:hypothetical protein n=1 Tax=Bartonella florencae TaxID=928210 RepID=UPI0002F9916D|nr:hypothetical protein [Bartonella florencae]
MTKLFKNKALNNLIVAILIFSQVTNVHANYLKNTSKKIEIADCVIEKNKTIGTVSFHIPDFNYATENKAFAERKIEKVLEPITIGTFGIGMAIGYATSAAAMLLGWIISKIVKTFK